MLDFLFTAVYTCEIIKREAKITSLPDGELNPGLPRDRRGYSPLYYLGPADTLPAYTTTGGALQSSIKKQAVAGVLASRR